MRVDARVKPGHDDFGSVRSGVLVDAFEPKVTHGKGLGVSAENRPDSSGSRPG